uniref:Protein I n=1 Tax=Murine coronavirus (strain 2) TaxID=76344 RepID=O72589_CVM2|nr:unknown [Murine hepatitis virus strain 2]
MPVAEAPLETALVMASSRRPLGLTKPSVEIEAEGTIPSRLQLLSPMPGVWFPITLGFRASPSFKRERSSSLHKDRECLLPVESPLQSKRDIGIDTTDVLLKHLMASTSSYCPDGIFTILEQGPMLAQSMATISKELSGSQANRPTLRPLPMLLKGTQAVMRLFLLSLRPARYCLKAFM